METGRLYMDQIGRWAKEDLVFHIKEAIEQHETEEKIKINMIGDESWSLVSWINDTDKLHTGNGQVNVTYEDGKLTSISATMKTPVHPVFDGTTVRVSTRMWIRPDRRSQNYMSLFHTLPGMEWAKDQGLSIVWTSFNSDRTHLVRRLEMMKHNERFAIRKIWEGWNEWPTLVELNGEVQRLVYRDLSKIAL